MLVAITAFNNLEIHQMNVKTAFLNGKLDEEIYIEQLEGFIVPSQEKKVRRLVKSLYGLKQAQKQIKNLTKQCCHKGFALMNAINVYT